MTRRRIGRLGGTEERPAIFFTGPEEFRSWLEVHHDTAPELWMGLSKRHVTDRGLTWAAAVPEALAFGWIDSKSEPVDDDARRQRWTPRRQGSTWSKVNIEIVERLLVEGRMAPAGIAAYEARRQDRSGIYSYENASAELSTKHAALLAADAKAAAFWAEATPSYRKVCTGWVCSAKQPATRDRRMAQLVDDCADGRLIKSQAYGLAPGWLERAAAAAHAAGA